MCVPRRPRPGLTLPSRGDLTLGYGRRLLHPVTQERADPGVSDVRHSGQTGQGFHPESPAGPAGARHPGPSGELPLPPGRWVRRGVLRGHRGLPPGGCADAGVPKGPWVRSAGVLLLRAFPGELTHALETGGGQILEGSIREHIAAGRCGCEVNNPQGSWLPG